MVIGIAIGPPEIVSCIRGWACNPWIAIALAEKCCKRADKARTLQTISGTSKQRDEMRVNSVQLSIQKSFGRISDGTVVATGCKCKRGQIRTRLL